MNSRELPWIEATFSNPQSGESVCSKALVDTGASITCIPEKFAQILDLQVQRVVMMKSIGGVLRCEQYYVNIQIGNTSFKQIVVGIPDIEVPLLGWDVFAQRPLFIATKIFGQIVHVLDAIPSFKQSTVLVLGQDTTGIHRLHAIQKRLKSHEYTGIIAKDIADIETQSIEEKINMLASLCRFVICENSFPSGHIDELKICALNRFITAILQKEGQGATWMQADYPLDFSFISTFTYPNLKQIDLAVDKAIKWAEKKIEERRDFFNKLYSWRENKK